ncbi:MAG: hypothetical protein E7813_07125 [Bradyrhizobium sp.]|uniref:hypothetical protein n=1 Tax=Bradyrhizobium sp. TaxID=376 RepID=UPI0012059200|nr:hypothetical protein [Bradyrhizobium sp.]THD70781.1 MAG: hypothetical protein E7813_07125 [Bradyrhizobium sp.]
MAEFARLTPANTMSKPVEELLRSIKDDFAAAKQMQEALEAKALFRLLNYCPPPTFGIAEPYPPSNAD